MIIIKDLIILAATVLELVTLSDYPQAQCNDGSTAVYYRPPVSSSQSPKKMMIYLKGGGYCVPGSPLTDITVMIRMISSDGLETSTYHFRTVTSDVRMSRISVQVR